jgi:hypothetical protein
VSGDRIYFSTKHHESIVYAVDAATGKEIWRFGRPHVMLTMTPPVVGEKAVFVATDAMTAPYSYYKGERAATASATCYALDKNTGKPLWEQKLPGLVWRAPALVDKVLWLVWDQKKIVGLTEDDGKVLHDFKPALIERNVEELVDDARAANGKGMPVPHPAGTLPQPQTERLDHMAAMPGYLFVTTTLCNEHGQTGPHTNSKHRLLVVKLPTGK